jgi:hypothetical protein
MFHCRCNPRATNTSTVYDLGTKARHNGKYKRTASLLTPTTEQTTATSPLSFVRQPLLLLFNYTTNKHLAGANSQHRHFRPLSLPALLRKYLVQVSLTLLARTHGTKHFLRMFGNRWSLSSPSVYDILPLLTYLWQTAPRESSLLIN